jgi:Tfp pilus assembly protein PilV
MYYWSVPTGIVFVGTFVLWSLLFAAIAWRALAQWWSARAATAYEAAMSFGEDEDYGTLGHNTQLTTTGLAASDYEGEPSRPNDTLSTDDERHSLSVPQDRDTEAEEQIVPTWTSHRSESRSSFDVVDDDVGAQGDKNDTGGDFPGLRRRQV